MHVLSNTKIYENSNRWLAAWGTVFSAFTPYLDIIHRPGRKHSNVDPLSWLPQAPPSHISLWQPEESTLTPSNDLIEIQENELNNQPVAKIKVLRISYENLAVKMRAMKSDNSDVGGKGTMMTRSRHGVTTTCQEPIMTHQEPINYQTPYEVP